MRKKKKNPHAQALGVLGGKARMRTLTPTERKQLAASGGATRAKKLGSRRRKEIAKLAVAARERGRAKRESIHEKSKKRKRVNL